MMPATTRHADIYRFFTQLLPTEELLYHSPLPLHKHYDPQRTTFVINRLILSLTPTQGVYEALSEPGVRSCVFLHRPFRLDRHRVPHGTLVLQSHVRYDEILTTGWNEAFADQHLVQRDARICIKGYKNNPERKIGLVGKLSTSMDATLYAHTLSVAFNGHDAMILPQHEGHDNAQILGLASLNAFTPEVLERVAQAAETLDIPPTHLMCLTGAVRDPGVEEAKRLGMSIVAVGHKRCEDWGMQYIAGLARARFPNLEIIHIDEPEERPEQRTKERPGQEEAALQQTG